MPPFLVLMLLLAPNAGSVDVKPLYELAELFMEMRQPDRAADFWKVATRVAQTNFSRLQSYPAALLQRGDPAGALAVATGPLGALPDVMRVSRAAITVLRASERVYAASAAMMQAVARVVDAVELTKEGHVLEHKEQAHAFMHIALESAPRQVCEVGFNLGHSALLFLETCGNCTVLSFDLGVHPGSRPAAAWIQEHYPNRLRVVWGDSHESLKRIESLDCEMVHIDGDHSVEGAWLDIQNLKRIVMRARRTPPLVLVDDTFCLSPWCGGATLALSKAMAAGLVQPNLTCSSFGGNSHKRARGWCMGHFGSIDAESSKDASTVAANLMFARCLRPEAAFDCPLAALLDSSGTCSQRLDPGDVSRVLLKRK